MRMHPNIRMKRVYLNDGTYVDWYTEDLFIHRTRFGVRMECCWTPAIASSICETRGVAIKDIPRSIIAKCMGVTVY